MRRLEEVCRSGRQPARSAVQADALRLAVLGPVRARSGECVLLGGPPVQQAVLVMLALRAGEPVPVADLVDGVWGRGVPDDAGRVVRACALRLRRTLALGRPSRGDAARSAAVLRLAGSGYVLDVAPEHVDAFVFERLLTRAVRGYRQSAEQTAQLLDLALAMWSGTALAGVVGPFAGAERIRLERLRLTAVELAALPVPEPLRAVLPELRLVEPDLDPPAKPHRTRHVTWTGAMWS